LHNYNSYLDLVQIKIYDRYHVFKQPKLFHITRCNTNRDILHINQDPRSKNKLDRPVSLMPDTGSTINKLGQRQVSDRNSPENYTGNKKEKGTGGGQSLFLKNTEL